MHAAHHLTRLFTGGILDDAVPRDKTHPPPSLDLVSAACSARRAMRAVHASMLGPAVLVALAAGCISDVDDAAEHPPPHLPVAPGSLRLAVGDTVRLEIMGDTSAAPLEWSTEPRGIADIGAGGEVVGRSPGTTLATVSDGVRGGWAVITVAASRDDMGVPVLLREDSRFRLDGVEISPFGLRAANLLQSDAIANRFVASMDDLLEHGIQSFSLTLQGGRHTHGGNSAFNAYYRDGSLKPEYAQRLVRILDAARRKRMVPVVVMFYQGRDQELADTDAVHAAVRNTVELLRPWRHLWINAINEPNHAGYDQDILTTHEGQRELYRLAKSVDSARIVYVSHETGANDGFLSDSWGRLDAVSPPAQGDVMIEYARGWPEQYDSFREPGVFPEGWMQRAIRDADESVQRGGYWFLLACWHQKSDADGWPRFDAGGVGTRADPGVRPIWDRMRELTANAPFRAMR